MKLSSFALGATLCSAAVFAEPVIDASTFKVKQDTSRNVVVTYTLNNDPAIVTLQAFTNGVALPGTCVRTLAGDVCKPVEPGARRLYWNARKDLPDIRLQNGELSVKLTAWSLSTPPPYMVIDLSKANTRFYYADVDALPYGHPTNTVAYKRDYLVMRRIPAAGVRWRQGSPDNESGRLTDGREDTRYVTLTQDYYMGIFEVTEGQVATVLNRYWIVGHTDANAGDPQTLLSYNNFRGAWDDGAGFGWPEKGHAAGGVIAQFRERTGLRGLDLPTAAQWEYACRAGEGGALNVPGAVVGDVAWYNGNSDGHPHPVGQKLPNAWGLYDMLGNVEEYMLDVFFVDWPYVRNFDLNGEYVDPIGQSSGSKYGSNRVTKGGYWGRPDYLTRNAFVTSQEDWKDESHGRDGPAFGFRLVCPIDPTAKGVPLIDADNNY